MLWFHDWAWKNYQRFDELLEDGERVVGEWLAQAHGTRYRLPHEPFVVFDLMRGDVRVSREEFWIRIAKYGFVSPQVVWLTHPCSVEAAMRLVQSSAHGALDPVEGAVWRVERRGKVDFLAKYVRPDKVDGCYLPEQSGIEAVWNWLPDKQTISKIVWGLNENMAQR